MTAPRENGTWKYAVWNNQGRLIYMRRGIDPTGGTNPTAVSVQWTPRMYSHRHYSNVAKTAVAQSTNVTVFISMKGVGVEWHLYAVDECVLSHEDIPTRFSHASIGANGVFQSTVASKANRTNAFESSVDLRSWSPLTNVLNKTGLLQWADPGATNYGRRLYRAHVLR